MKKIRKIMVIAGLSLAVAALAVGCGADGTEEESEASEDTQVAAEQTQEESDSGSQYADFAGEYQDIVSERASAVVTVGENNDSVSIVVSWASSASETDTWTMEATLDGNRLVYENGTYLTTTYEEDENDDEALTESEQVNAENQSGYFELGDNGELMWTGAADDSCKDCIFVKLETEE